MKHIQKWVNHFLTCRDFSGLRDDKYIRHSKKKNWERNSPSFKVLVSLEGRKELKELARFASMGRVKLEEPGRIEGIPNELSNIERDERVIQNALEYNNILLTADNTMKAHSIAENIFTIFA